MYDWAFLRLDHHGPVPAGQAGEHWLLVRRNQRTGELAFYRCYTPRPSPLAVLVRVAGWLVAVASAGVVVGLPIAVGLAILRYRLYDIDRLISRALVYGLLTAVLGLCYAAGSLVSILVVGVGSGPPSWLVAATTLSKCPSPSPLWHLACPW